MFFQVFGLPAPQGSKRHVGNGVMVETSKNLKPWREAVITAAREHHEGPALDGAISLAVEFVMPRPKSARKYASWQTTAPDLDKLVRATLDALKIAGMIADDARIARLAAQKKLASLSDPWTGAHISLLVMANGERAS